jgi:hypothetical protein
MLLAAARDRERIRVDLQPVLRAFSGRAFAGHVGRPVRGAVVDQDDPSG